MQNKTFVISRRKAIASLLTTGAVLSTGLATTPAAFAATRSAFAQNPTPKKLKATIKKSKVAFKHQTLKGKSARATLKPYTLKTNTQAKPFSANDPNATFTAYPVNTTSNPENTGIIKGDDGSSFWFAETGANRIGKITTQGAITEYLLPLSGYSITEIANGPGDSFWFTYDNGGPSFVGSMVGASGKVTLYALPSDFNGNLTSIIRGPNNTLWFGSLSGNIGSITADGAITTFDLSGVQQVNSIASGADGALWFTFYGQFKNPNGIGRLTTSGDLTIYPMSEVSNAITPGRNNDLWFTEATFSRIGNITTDGQLTIYQLPSGTYPDNAITRLNNDTFAFAATSANGKYIGIIDLAGDVQLFETPNDDRARRMVYAGWANEVWFTTTNKIYKFRVTS